MRFETFIGRRQLFSRERLLRVRLTTAIATLSVAVGVAALIVVIGVLDGLDAQFHRKYMDLVSHMEALPPGETGEELFEDPGAVAAALAEDPRVEALAPLIRRDALLLPERDLAATMTAVQLLGVHPQQTREVAGFVERTVAGHGDPGPDEVVLGQLLAERVLGVGVGDTVWAITRFTVDANAVPHVRWAELRVVGLFMTGIPELDISTAYVDMETARRIFVLPPGATSAFQLHVADPHHARATAAAIAQDHPGLGARLRSWDETNPEFFQALQLERVGTFVMLLMIVLVASFNIIGTLVRIVVERTREIGILKTVGASDAVIRRIFLRSGALIGLGGTTLGLALGLLICWVISRVEINLPEMLYDLHSLPVALHWSTVAFIAAASMAICLAASVVPAQSAARLDPVEALRHD